MGILNWLGIGKDIKDSADGIGDNVTKIISVAKGKLPPEQQVEIEKLQAEVDIKLAEIRSKSEETLRGFIVQYEGSADQVPKWLLVWRSLIRPVFTTFILVQFGGVLAIDAWRLVTQHIPFSELLLGNMPTAWWWIVGIVITFWFGGHGVERAVEKLNGKEKK